MSKKLLLNKYSKKGIIPVKDDLICWLDGLDGNGTDNVWCDRSNNSNNVMLKSFRFDNNSGWMGTGLRFKSSDSSYCEFNKPLIPDICTIELSCLPDKGHIDSSFISQSVRGDHYSSNRMNIGLEADGTITWYKVDQGISKHCRSKQSYNSNLNKKIHLVYTCDNKGDAKNYFDGIKVNETVGFNLTGFSRDVNTMIGRHGNKIFSGIIYSVKIYSRVLTDEEIYKNFMYEQTIERGH